MSRQDQPPGPLQPSWTKILAAAVLITAGFLLPQELPLTWYPLPLSAGSGNQLEITCAANVTGEASVRYDVAGVGHRPHDMIRWAVAPTAQTYTYRFPLPDAPITELLVTPPRGGELLIRSMRILGRDGEVRRFTRDLFRSLSGVTISPDEEGWRVIAAPGAVAPAARIELFSHIVPAGMNHRNLQRCLQSVGYLAMLLTVLLLGLLFTVQRPAHWRGFMGQAGFITLLAAGFAIVGNRGLIRDYLQFSRYEAPVLPPGLKLELDLNSSGASIAQLFWDTGSGFNEEESSRQNLESHPGSQTLRFPLPDKLVTALRYDPRDNPGSVEIRGIRIVDTGQNTRAVLPLDSLRAMQDIAILAVRDDTVRIETTAEARDAITVFNAPALRLLDQALPAPAFR